MRSSTLLIAVFIFVVPSLLSQTKGFTKNQILEDLQYLEQALLKHHPNAFLYSDKNTFEKAFNKIKVPTHVSEEEAYGIIASTASIVKDGHSYIFLNKEKFKYVNKNSRFMPFKVLWNGSDLFISENYTNNEALAKGTKIISINGTPAEELIYFMLERIMRDGNNLQYPLWIINSFFYEYYNYFFGSAEAIKMTLIKPDGVSKAITINGIPKTELFNQISEKAEAEKRAIYFELKNENKIGILSIKDWHNDVLRKYYNQNFKKAFNPIIKEIEKSQIEYLIIDIRDNQGGNLSNSKLVLSHLLNHPFEIIEGYNKLKKGNLFPCGGPQLGTHKPNKYIFEGEVIVLINGGSFSNSGIFSSVLKKYNRATFVGEETGGSAYILSAESKKIKLPNTGIRYEIPTLQFVIKKSEEAHLGGVKPDHLIPVTIQSIIEGKDIQKDFAVSVFSKKSLFN